MGTTPEGGNGTETLHSEDFEFAALQEARHYREWILSEMAPHLKGRVLEVGAGIGQITAMVARLGTVETVCGVEPDPAYRERLRQVLSEDRIFPGTIADVPESIEWDGMVCVNVLEHIEDDEGTLKQCADRLRKRGGALCLYVPARPEIYAPIDRDFGHFRRYTKPGLARKLRAAGFAIERLHYCNLPGYFIWLLNFKLLGECRFSPKKMRFNDRFIVPVTAFVERHLARPPIGQSLFVVARA
jgi:SAM-dependent methyltransferase